MIQATDLTYPSLTHDVSWYKTTLDWNYSCYAIACLIICQWHSSLLKDSITSTHPEWRRAYNINQLIWIQGLDSFVESVSFFEFVLRRRTASRVGSRFCAAFRCVITLHTSRAKISDDIHKGFESRRLWACQIWHQN